MYIPSDLIKVPDFAILALLNTFSRYNPKHGKEQNVLDGCICTATEAYAISYIEVKPSDSIFHVWELMVQMVVEKWIFGKAFNIRNT